MTTLLPRLQQLLTTTFVDDVTNGLKLVKIAPFRWLQQNLNAVKFPLLTLWEDRTTLVKGKIANTFDEELTVVLTLYYNLTDPTALMFNDKRGIFPLSDAIFSYLNENKKLHGPVLDAQGKPTGEESCVVSGLRLPYDFVSVEGQLGASFYCEARSMRARYYRTGFSYGSAENSSVPTVTNQGQYGGTIDSPFGFK